MPEREPAVEPLSTLLEQLQLQDGTGKSPPAVAQAQVDLLLARIAALTGWLRGADDTCEASRAAARLLLADVAMIVAQFRGETNALDARLDAAIDAARAALEHSADGPPTA